MYRPVKLRKREHHPSFTPIWSQDWPLSTEATDKYRHYARVVQWLDTTDLESVRSNPTVGSNPITRTI